MPMTCRIGLEIPFPLPPMPTPATQPPPLLTLLETRWSDPLRPPRIFAPVPFTHPDFPPHSLPEALESLNHTLRPISRLIPSHPTGWKPTKAGQAPHINDSLASEWMGARQWRPVCLPPSLPWPSI